MNATITSNEDFIDDGNGTSNCSNDYCESPEDYDERVLNYIYPDHYEWALIVAHIIVFIVGLVGNALVCVAVFRNTSMRTVTNYFIVNLAVADFLVILICQPTTVVWDVTNTWFLGDALCKILLYFQTVSVSVSVLTLTVISVERWYAICYPLKFKATTGRAKRLILLIWVIALIVDIPELVVLETIPHEKIDHLFTRCEPNWSQELDIIYIVLRALILYIIPLMFMSVAYYQIVKVLWKSETIPGDRTLTPIIVSMSNGSQHEHAHINGNGVTHLHTNGRCNGQLLTPVIRGVSTSHCSQAEYQLKSRRKAAKMLVAVVVMFAMCYFPVYFYNVLILTGIDLQNEFKVFFGLIAHWLCYANSAVNPLIYNFMSGKFRREFSRAFQQCICFRDPYSPATSRIYTYNVRTQQTRQSNLAANNTVATNGRIWC